MEITSPLGGKKFVFQRGNQGQAGTHGHAVIEAGLQLLFKLRDHLFCRFPALDQFLHGENRRVLGEAEQILLELRRRGLGDDRRGGIGHSPRWGSCDFTEKCLSTRAVLDQLQRGVACGLASSPAQLVSAGQCMTRW